MNLTPENKIILAKVVEIAREWGELQAEESAKSIGSDLALKIVAVSISHVHRYFLANLTINDNTPLIDSLKSKDDDELVELVTHLVGLSFLTCFAAIIPTGPGEKTLPKVGMN
jgi:hypothetical protein